MHALVGHHLVHEPEAPQRVRVGERGAQARPRAGSCTFRASLTASPGRSSRRCSGSCCGPRLLARRASPVLVHDRRPAPSRSSSRRRRSPDPACRAARRRPPRRRSAASRSPAARSSTPPTARRAPRPDRPVDRAGPPDRELEPVPVLQVQPPQLVDPAQSSFQQRSYTGRNTALPAGVTVSFVWYSHIDDRDLPRRLPVVAQRDLDKQPPAVRVVVAVHPQQTVSRSGIVVIWPTRQLGQPRWCGISIGSALVVADRRPALVTLSVCTVS